MVTPSLPRVSHGWVEFARASQPVARRGHLESLLEERNTRSSSLLWDSNPLCRAGREMSRCFFCTLARFGALANLGTETFAFSSQTGLGVHLRQAKLKKLQPAIGCVV